MSDDSGMIEINRQLWVENKRLRSALQWVHDHDNGECKVVAAKQLSGDPVPLGEVVLHCSECKHLSSPRTTDGSECGNCAGNHTKI